MDIVQISGQCSAASDLGLHCLLWPVCLNTEVHMVIIQLTFILGSRKIKVLTVFL